MAVPPVFGDLARPPKRWCPSCKRMINAHEIRADGHHEKLVFDKPLHGGIGGRWVVCKEPTRPKP